MKHALLTLLLVALPMKAWHIMRWNETFENNKSRDIETLSYFLQPNNLDGEGVGYLMLQPDGCEIYGVFGFLKALASKSKLPHRGWLFRNGSPLTTERMQALTRVPLDKLDRTLKFLSTAPMDWMEFADMPGTATSGGGHTKGTATSGGGHVAGSNSSGLSTDSGLTEVPNGGGAPSDEQVFAYGDSKQFERAFVGEWIAQMAGRTRGWPADWQRKLEADYRVRATKGDFQKKPAAKRERWQVEKDLAALKIEISGHPAMSWPGNKPMPAKTKKKWAALASRRADLEKELNACD